MRIVSFDGTEAHEGELARPDRFRHLYAELRRDGPMIPRGAGLSYCAASSGEGVRSVLSARFNRILEFDAAKGRATVEAGITLGELYRFSVPRGWILPVMPGHPSITVGGCIAFNVHGKNQHREGCFSGCVEELALFHPDHGEIICSSHDEPGVFELTIGGMGLTGFIVRAKLALQKVPAPSFKVRRIPATGLLEAVKAMKGEANAEELHSWHDFNGPAFGRGFVYASHRAPENMEERPKYEALDPVTRGRWGIQALNGWTTKLALSAHALRERLSPEETRAGLFEACFPVCGREFFFKLFGRRGFREYQMLFPERAWEEASKTVEHEVRASAAPIALASLKLFRGKQKLLNFEGDGICLAIDAAEGERARRLFAALDKIVLSAGGIVNLSKDSRLGAEVVRKAFPEYDTFRERLAVFDPKRRFDSALRRRIGV